MSVDWERVKRIFLEARELEASQREAFVEREARGDDAVRHAARQMLANDDAAFLSESLLTRPIRLPTADALLSKQGMDSIGPYRVLDIVGEGSSGVVYAAVRRGASEAASYAIKVLKHGFVGDARERRFEQELRALRELEHSAIVKVRDEGSLPDGRRYFAMDLVDGAALGGETTPRDIAARVELLTRIARAIATAHDAGIVHRDLKPGNILVDREGKPRILDFGVARFLDRDDASLTASGQLLGTVPYMCPAQLRGERDQIDARSDVYALGVVAYELFAGVLPFRETKLDALVRSICEGRCARLRRHDPTLPVALETIVHCALDPDPERRYADATEFAEDLERFQRGQAIHARELPARTRVRRFVAQHRGLVAGVSLAFLALVAGIVATSLALFEAIEQRSLASSRLRDLEVERANVEANFRSAQRAEAKARAAQGEAERDRKRAEDVREYLVRLMKAGPPSSLRTLLLESAMSLREQFAGDPAAEADVARAVAMGLWAYGEQDESRALFERAYEVALQEYGARHARTLQHRSDLTRLLVDLGEHDVDRIRDECQVMLEVMGAESEAYVAHLSAYLRALTESNRIAEGVDAARTLARLCTKRDGPTSMGAIDARCALARAYYAAGDRERSDKVFASTLLVAARVRARSHAYGMVQYNRASVLIESSPREAVPLLERAIASLEAGCGHGDECPIELQARHNLASAYFLVGRVDDARREFATTLATSYAIARIDWQEGEAERVITRLQRDLEAARSKRGARNLRAQIYRLLLASQEKLGRKREAQRTRRDLDALGGR